MYIIHVLLLCNNTCYYLLVVIRKSPSPRRGDSPEAEADPEWTPCSPDSSRLDPLAEMDPSSGTPDVICCNAACTITDLRLQVITHCYVLD